MGAEGTRRALESLFYRKNFPLLDDVRRRDIKARKPVSSAVSRKTCIFSFVFFFSIGERE